MGFTLARLFKDRRGVVEPISDPTVGKLRDA